MNENESLTVTLTLDKDVYKRQYLLLAGQYEPGDIIVLIRDMFSFISSFEGEVPGASAKDCGNYLDMNLPMAKYVAKKYLQNVLIDIQDKQMRCV